MAPNDPQTKKPGDRIEISPGRWATIGRVLPGDGLSFWRVKPTVEFINLVVIFDEPDAHGNLGDLIQVPDV